MLALNARVRAYKGGEVRHGGVPDDLQSASNLRRIGPRINFGGGGSIKVHDHPLDRS